MEGFLLRSWKHQQGCDMQVPCLTLSKRQKHFFLTCYWIWPWHKVKRNGLHWLGQDGLQVPLGDFVQAVGGGRHVLIHAVQAGVHAGLLGLPRLQVSSRSKFFTAFPSILGALHIFRVACQSSLKEEITNKVSNKEISLHTRCSAPSCAAQEPRMMLITFSTFT